MMRILGLFLIFTLFSLSRQSNSPLNQVKVLFINDKDRVDEQNIQSLDKETKAIFKEACTILKKNFTQIHFEYMGNLNLTKKSIFPKFKTSGEDLKIKKLKYLSRKIEEMKSQSRKLSVCTLKKSRKLSVCTLFRSNLLDNSTLCRNNLLNDSTLIILLTTKDEDEIEGLTFIGGNGSGQDGYSLISLDKEDPIHYKGKVVAHEILHSLGAQHSGHSLMAETFEESESGINNETIEEVGRYIWGEV